MKKSFMLNIVICFLLNVLLVFNAFASDVSMSEVVLHGLDKITGRLSTMTIKVGEKEKFGALDIYVRVCNSTPPEETPENTSFLEIIENHVDGQSRVFSGWMFSSSPSLSAMEHPVYDIWVVKCSGEPKTAPKPFPIVLEHEIQPKSGINKFKFNLVDMEKEQKEKKEEALKQRLKNYSEKTEEVVEENTSNNSLDNEEEQVEEIKEALSETEKENENAEEKSSEDQEKSQDEQEISEEASKEDVQEQNVEEILTDSINEEIKEEKVEELDPTDPDYVENEENKKVKE